MIDTIAGLIGTLIDADSPLMAVGLDSLNATELVQKLSVQLEVDLP
ncbi:phosphopantetheine-binding protein [bacterium]|nr:phosphopantetheine-binding protein [bacterium]